MQAQHVHVPFQVAIKTSLDIFYFHVQFDLSTVLLEDAALSRDEFTPIWQRVGEGGWAVEPVGSCSRLLKVLVRSDSADFLVSAQMQRDTSWVALCQAFQCECCVASRQSHRMSQSTEISGVVPLFPGQKVTMINLDRPLDAETLKGRLQAENICYVAQRQQLGVERLCCPRIRRLDPRVAKDRLVDSAKALASCY